MTSPVAGERAGGPSRPGVRAEGFDHLDPTVGAADVRAAYNEMRERCPVVHIDRYGGFDLVTRYAEVRAALDDAATFSSADGIGIPPTGAPPVPALEFDEPEHGMWRALLDGPLSRRAVRELEPGIAAVADRLIDAFAAAGHADLISALAEPLPAIVIGRMVGLDDDQALEARDLAAALFAGVGSGAFAKEMEKFATYTSERLAERRANPRDDFLTKMASGSIDGMAIDDEGAVGLMVAYLVGGHHSTGSGIAGIVRHVLSVPGLRDEVVEDPRDLMRAVEESLRLTTPLQLFARSTRCPSTWAVRRCRPGRASCSTWLRPTEICGSSPSPTCSTPTASATGTWRSGVVSTHARASTSRAPRCALSRDGSWSGCPISALMATPSRAASWAAR